MIVISWEVIDSPEQRRWSGRGNLLKPVQVLVKLFAPDVADERVVMATDRMMILMMMMMTADRTIMICAAEQIFKQLMATERVAGERLAAVV